MKRRKQRYTATQWAQMIDEQQHGVESIDIFCARIGVGTSTFNKWRRRVTQSPAMPSIRTSARNGFVEELPPSKAQQPITLRS